MKIVIFGSGLIGSQVAAELADAGHDVKALGRGGGIADAVEGAPKPQDGTVEIAEPEPLGIDELVRRLFVVTGDNRSAIFDCSAPGNGAWIACESGCRIQIPSRWRRDIANRRIRRPVLGAVPCEGRPDLPHLRTCARKAGRHSRSGL
ncbi:MULTISPECIES: hypothetical protein [unclassified Rhodococcus (in: high G+C Gram-positive bacteria)]|uniref:hypothetical protein n=1 Tax=unclassified Rhodococcus (in: high G+C Gram-positive bacteria) TaxID=192944 RepID=UPI000717F171|nr:hypothetical protein [Rhodococcus sp. KB6]